MTFTINGQTLTRLFNSEQHLRNACKSIPEIEELMTYNLSYMNGNGSLDPTRVQNRTMTVDFNSSTPITVV